MARLLRMTACTQRGLGGDAANRAYALLLPMTTIASAIPHNTVILEVTNQTTKYLEYCGRPAQSAGVQTFLPSRQ